MKCPHCNYVYGWDTDKLEDKKPQEGGFYTLSRDIQVERPTGNYCEKDIARLYACPNCKKVFISED